MALFPKSFSFVLFLTLILYCSTGVSQAGTGMAPHPGVPPSTTGPVTEEKPVDTRNSDGTVTRREKKPDGTETETVLEWDPNKHVWVSTKITEVKPNGTKTETFFEKGVATAQVWYNSDGKKVKQIEYKNGKVEKQAEYDPKTGKITKIDEFNPDKSGKTTEYRSDGTAQKEIDFYPGGQAKETRVYGPDGKTVTKKTEYNKNGDPTKVTEFDAKTGQKTKDTEYWPNGDPKKMTEYLDGKPIKIIEFDKQGHPIPETLKG